MRDQVQEVLCLLVNLCRAQAAGLRILCVSMCLTGGVVGLCMPTKLSGSKNNQICEAERLFTH